MEELARIVERGVGWGIVVCGDSGFRRDGTWRYDNNVDCLFNLARNVRPAERMGR